jgi:hypothetical protein
LASESKDTFEKKFFGVLTVVKNKTRKQTPFSVAFRVIVSLIKANYCANMERFESQTVMRVSEFVGVQWNIDFDWEGFGEGLASCGCDSCDHHRGPARFSDLQERNNRRIPTEDLNQPSKFC